MTANSATEDRSLASTIKSFVPILEWLPKYKKSWLRWDLIAALTVWALLVPEAMAYAGIAGMPPEAGLYAAPLALLGYAVFGTSRQLNVGPSSTVAVLSFAVVGGLVSSGDTDLFIAYTVTLALLTGIVLIISGLLKLGVLADFMSKPVLAGFIVGLAISIAVGQLDKVVGFEPEAQGLIPEILLYVRNIGETHLPTLAVGLASLVLLFLIDKYIPKLPSSLTVVVLAIVASAVLNLESYGVHIVGDIPAGLPPIGLPQGITLSDVSSLLLGAAAIAVVGFAESVAAARTYATKHGYEVDANQEMIALGAANLGAGISQGFVVDGSLSKTAASDGAGAKSQMTSIIVAVMVLITLVALTPLFHDLPEATLGAVVIHAVWHLIDLWHPGRATAGHFRVPVWVAHPGQADTHSNPGQTSRGDRVPGRRTPSRGKDISGAIHLSFRWAVVLCQRAQLSQRRSSRSGGGPAHTPGVGRCRSHKRHRRYSHRHVDGTQGRTGTFRHRSADCPHGGSCPGIPAPGQPRGNHRQRSLLSFRPGRRGRLSGGAG